MRFEKPAWPMMTGKILGYIAAYFLFTIVLWVILWIVKGEWVGPLIVIASTLLVAFIGEVLRWWLR